MAIKIATPVATSMTARDTGCIRTPQARAVLPNPAILEARRVRASGSTGLKDHFNRLADQLATALGSLPALVASVVLVLGWAVTGPPAP